MTTRIDIIAPASISLLGSIVAAPGPPITLVDGAGGVVSVTVSAGNAAARLGASAAGGAAVSSNANTLSISGTAAQVNAALASLSLSDTGADVLSLSASSAGVLSAVSAIAVTEIPTAGPVFVAPPGSFAIAPYSITNIAGLVLADPAATALAAAGLGGSETMAVTVSVASGVLFLPGLSALSGIAATGVGTAEIVLNFTADQLAGVNSLLSGLAWAGPAAVSGLAFAARDVAGPLGASITSGNIVLDITGTQGAATSLTTGADAAILGAVSLSLGTTLNIYGMTSDIGGISGQGAVFVAPGTGLEVPYNALSLGGTSYDFGGLGAGALAQSGTLLAASGAVVGGLVNLGSAGELDFTGTLIAGAADTIQGMVDISLSAGALLTGSGNLLAGNFSESGLITGAGTILAGAGETLLVAAGQISGVALNVAAGGVLELGPVDPLFGIFTPTPLTIGPSMVLSFLNNGGGAAASGGFADTLAQTGGAIVITSPAVFSGKIVNFTAGDRLIFPGLTGITLTSISSNGFVVLGPDSSGITQSYTINAAIPLGMTVFQGLDAAGDSEVSLRAALPGVYLNGASISVAALLAQPGTPQPLAGLDILAASWSGQSLAVTLTVSHGVLSGAGVTAGAQVILSAASPAALNAALQGISYTASAGAVADLMTITSINAPLTGLLGFMPIALGNTASVTAGYFGDAGQVALFSDASAVPVQGVAAPGEVVVTGAKVFDASLDITGLNGTALQVAGDAVAVFDPGAVMALQADASIAAGGMLAVLTESFAVSGNVSVAGTAIISGALTATGALLVAGSVSVSGSLVAGSASISAGGDLAQTGGQGRFGSLTVAGVLDVVNAGSISAASLALSGVMDLGGNAALVSSGVVSTSGSLVVGPDGRVMAGGLNQTAGVLSLGGMADFAGAVTLDGLALLGGGTLLAPFVSLQAGALLIGGGVVGAVGSLGVMVVNGGTVIAAGDLILAEDVTLSNGGAISLAGSSALDIFHAVTGGTIEFAGSDAVLTINDAGQFSAAVGGMLDHDVIDLIGVAPSLVSFSGGQVSVVDGNGVAVGQFGLAVAAGQPAVQILADGAGGSLITLGGDMPCFARGTRLLTPNGYRPVETLRPGDPVITLGGERRAVRWVGWRTLDLNGYDKAQPVLFAPHALGPGMPKRGVCLSPLHAVWIGGVLVPACHLVNGATIKVAKQAAVTYYHIELDRHEILLAEGMAAESFIDNGNRRQLYTELGVRGRACQPVARLVTGGAELAAIRWRLHEIALQAGFSLTYQPGLRAVAAGASVLPDIRRNRGRREMRFAFPKAAGALGLVARTAAPADTDPDCDDRRQLGICLAGLPPGVRLGAGWFEQAGGDAGIWMGAAGRLDFEGKLRQGLTLGLAAVIRSWVAPAPTILGMRG